MPCLQTTLHGVCVEVCGVGVLLVGESGSGKTECGLDLLARGHRFVGDDGIKVSRIGKTLRARAAGDLGFHMHLRDIGVIDVRRIFGPGYITAETVLGVIVELLRQREPVSIDNELGLATGSRNILEVTLPCYKIAETSVRDSSLLTEVIVRSEILKMRGVDMAAEFNIRHLKKLSHKS